MKFKRSGSWNQGTPKLRRNGQWVTAGAAGGSGSDTSTAPTDSGFGWDQTFTDTSWVESAGDDLNVEKVTTTESTGSGSIKAALDNAADGPTVVVFEVGGVIQLDPDEELKVRSPEVWIAGETAPDPGITITRGRVRIYEPRVIMSHISVLIGDGTDGASDGLVLDADDIMVDHCTVAWGTDENAGASNAVARGSFINSIFAEALYDSIHPEGKHSRGMLFNDEGSTDLAVMGCLFSHSNRRNPMSRGDMVIANNYVYNYGGLMAHFNGSSNPDVTAAGLLYEEGNDSDSEVEVFQYGAKLYTQSVETKPNDHPLTDGDSEMVDSPPILPDGLDIDKDVVPASEVKEFVLARTGPRPARRPEVEKGIVSRLNSDYGFVDSQSNVGGYPTYTEQTRTLDVPSSGLLDWVRGYKRDVEVSTEKKSSSKTPN
ncbi:hypothetical protein [Haloarcula laminariae]|uniref:hypothetical protein n=1 Tax=Haloarcula laminariae TaxID=2961577 RepID=UPI002407571D|nr:hypothetical protein [Halomicroarcula sp. FL173]